ncbi:amidohydrolase family protein [Nocardia fusca]|uniref:amidohydrolase family protein n=1 Tax=Nocardia fusca TaxID=941183 RepID=UPI0037AC1BF4
MSVEPWTIISIDDHLIEPEGTWTSRVSAKYKDRCPQVVRNPTGEGWNWQYDGNLFPFNGLQCVVGQDSADWSTVADDFESLHAGCYDSQKRLADLDAAGVVGSLCFPTMPGFGATWINRTDDHELAYESIRAFNDFVLDEWCAAAPGRYIPLVIMPHWDTALAAKEMKRTADRGARAIAFSERPHQQGYASLFDKDHYWDPFFHAAVENGLTICCHIGSSSKIDAPSDANYMDFMSVTWMNAPYSMTEYILSETFDRVPDLKVVYSEASIGWIPFILQTMNRYYANHSAWTKYGLKNRPSEYFGKNVFGAFIEDPFGASLIGTHLSVEAVMAEVDYPHTDSIFPDVQKVIQDQVPHLTPEQEYLIRRGNAERVFNFVPSGIGQR